MTNAQLARKAARQAARELRRGNIDKNTYEVVMASCQDQAILTEWNQRIYDAKLNPWDHDGLYGRVAAFDFASIWDWFAANWPKILEILLVIIPLFLGANDENPSS